jgi:hypothetical protein
MQKHLVKLLGTLVVGVAAIAMLAPMASAKPAPPYEQFAGCPVGAPGISSCIHSVVQSGKFKLGTKEVPIEKPIPLTGGTSELTGPIVFNSEGGLGVVNQKVPGGVIGLTGLTWLLEFLGSEALTLYAAAELVGTPVAEGLGVLKLPLRTHMINNVLGKNCYIGSAASPISLKLQLTNEPTLTFDFATEILKVANANYVDKTFSAPGANGCVLTLFGFIPISINGLVNSASGLPAATGNEAVQLIQTELVEASLVK